MFRLTLETLQDDVEHSVGIKIEISDDRLDHLNDVCWRDSGEILQTSKSNPDEEYGGIPD